MKNTTLLTLIAAWALVLSQSVCSAVPLEGSGSSGVPGMINYQGRVTVGGVNFSGTGQFKFALVDGGVNQNQAATATATVVGGQVTQIFRITMGNGYTSAPEVTITNGAGSNGTGATAVAALGGGPGSGTGPTDSVGTITITNPGSGYTFAIVTIAPPPPNIVSTSYWSNDGSSNAGGAPESAVPLDVAGGLYSVALGDLSLAHMTTALPASVFDNPDVRLRVWFNDGTHGSQLLSPDQRFATVPYAFRAAIAQSVPTNSITSSQLADGAVLAGKIADGAVSGSKLATAAVGADRLDVTGTASAGKVLGYGNGGTLTWVTPSGGGGGITLPYNNSFSDPSSLLGLSNDGGDGLYGETSSPTHSGVFGRNDVEFTLSGQSAGQGVYGYGSHVAVGVLGVSQNNDGIVGRTNAGNHIGVFGYTEATNSAGVKGVSMNGDAVVGITSKAGKSGVVGFASLADNNAVAAINGTGTGVFAQTGGAAAVAGFFWNTAGGDAIRTTGDIGATGKITATGDIIANGAGNQLAYMGGDGNGDVEFGSKKASVTLAAFYNPTSGLLLDTLMRDASVRSLTIRGGADIAEPFAIGGGEALPRGSVVIIGEDRIGELRRSERAYDTRVAGIVSGANGVNTGLTLSQPGVNDTGGQQVALTGRVYCLADASNGPIKPGDLLTTSVTPGHAMKVTDHQRAQGAVLGKAMSALPEGTGYVLVLVTLQ